jgi:hypothetical protein
MSYKINILGDFSREETEDIILRYLNFCDIHTIARGLKVKDSDINQLLYNIGLNKGIETTDYGVMYKAGLDEATQKKVIEDYINMQLNGKQNIRITQLINRAKSQIKYNID